MKVCLSFFTRAPLNDHGRKESGCFNEFSIRQLLSLYHFQKRITK
jgi:hypothetical protein